MNGVTMMWSITGKWPGVSMAGRLTNAEFLSGMMSEIIKTAGLTEVDNSKFTYSFPAQDGSDVSGVTGMVVLLESHLSLHTWPETSYMRLELSSCRILDPDVLEKVHSYLRTWFGGKQIYEESKW
ncbi:MAG: S-adenosylmethionine decarboxylase [Candidatus Peribacteraceae bacterium]|nr:S-adenosylmethionine decarboxylase [Candidatus Peribacteraceae bacterium]